MNAERIMGMRTLGLGTGECVTVYANGEDEDTAIESIEKYLSGRK